MDHQRRRLEFVGEEVRRKFPIKVALFPRRTFEFPFRKPKLFRRAVSRFRIEHPVVRHDALEAVGMAQQPVGHVTAVARAQRGLAVLVDERIRLLHVIEPLHQIDIRLPAPIATDRVGKFLPVTGRAVEIDHHDHVIRSPRTTPRSSDTSTHFPTLLAARHGSKISADISCSDRIPAA